ncbi:MAG: tRNA (adenosine(37)-N6)-threonylcarbamoyltransferase complex transferase subunit TsaD, partial [Alphaproteobacteria bacterium]|nr:tRNA (adenosine(37)-N6)-threonylcarbamoyltransferase complex transferase subunit TsaD [Alphaproteobacteria bacterium]
EAAMDGDPTAFALARPMKGRPGCDFSFSGLKTSVRTMIEGRTLSPALVSDMSASLQAAISDSVGDRARHAFGLLRERNEAVTAFVAAGGVAANKALRARLSEIAQENGVAFAAPPPGLCTDNGVMVAWAGLERFRLGLTDALDVAARPRWPLEDIRKA